MIGASSSMAGDMESEKDFREGPIDGGKRWRRGHWVGHSMHKGPGAKTQDTGASTNSLEMTGCLDLVQVFQKTNRQMPLRVSDALNLFFFFNSN